ncbi:hypothetical protein GBAR_LOCUS26431 [Geodia barretti]|uniref:Uncharacterized protein n=1 Tax=Geodia barretti TaxID=519541 RepID=A0AA35X713_GEOBA|nr:hypothetical protein GBAR_LOCUS26431 [Geodia barretti]
MTSRWTSWRRRSRTCWSSPQVRRRPPTPATCWPTSIISTSTCRCSGCAWAIRR